MFRRARLNYEGMRAYQQAGTAARLFEGVFGYGSLGASGVAALAKAEAGYSGWNDFLWDAASLLPFVDTIEKGAEWIGHCW